MIIFTAILLSGLQETLIQMAYHTTMIYLQMIRNLLGNCMAHQAVLLLVASKCNCVKGILEVISLCVAQDSQ